MHSRLLGVLPERDVRENVEREQEAELDLDREERGSSSRRGLATV